MLNLERVRVEFRGEGNQNDCFEEVFGRGRFGGSKQEERKRRRRRKKKKKKKKTTATGIRVSSFLHQRLGGGRARWVPGSKVQRDTIVPFFFGGQDGRFSALHQIYEGGLLLGTRVEGGTARVRRVLSE